MAWWRAVVGGAALVAAFVGRVEPAGAQAEFDPVCGLQGGCSAPAPRQAPVAPPPATIAPLPSTEVVGPAPEVVDLDDLEGEPVEPEPVEPEPVEPEPVEPEPVEPEPVEPEPEPEGVDPAPGSVEPEPEPDPEDTDPARTEPVADRSEEPISEEALLVASGLLMMLLSAPTIVARRPRLGRRVASTLPATDAAGEPLVVQDGRYRGGRRGDVWWDRRWVSPDEARSLIAEQRAVRLRADAYAAAPEPAARPDRLLPGEVVGREASAANREARRRRVIARFHAERAVESGTDIAATELESADAFEKGRRRWDNVLWAADRGVDALASRTPKVFEKTFKAGYTIAKSTAEGLVEDYRADERDTVRIGRGSFHGFRRGLQEVAVDALADEALDAVGNHLPSPGEVVANARERWLPRPARELHIGTAPPKAWAVDGSWKPTEMAQHVRDGGYRREVARQAMEDMTWEATKGGAQDAMKDPVKQRARVKRAGLDPE